MTSVVDITFPLVFDLATESVLAGESLTIDDPDIQINITTVKPFKIVFNGTGGNGSGDGITFISGGSTPLTSMKVDNSSTKWLYSTAESFGTNEPECKLEYNSSTLSDGTTTSTVGNYPSKSSTTSLRRIIMEVIAEHYFNHPLATAPIENDDAIATKVNEVLQSLHDAWLTEGESGEVSASNELKAKRSIVEQFIDGSNSRISTVSGTSTLELNVDDDKVSFLIYFTNSVITDPIGDTSLLGTNSNKFTNSTSAETTYASFNKTLRLTFKKTTALL
jgi:hypothetical protein